MIKKIPLIAIIVGVILLIGGVIFVYKYSSEEALLGKRVSNSVSESFIDTDNDGLRDWEEELFKTDPRNPDTDGDGYLDGEEVNSGHNPLVKAPDDKLAFHPLPLGGKYNLTKKVMDEDAIESFLKSYILEKGEYIIDHPEIYSPESFNAVTEESTIKEMATRALAQAYPQLLQKAEDAISEIPDLFDIKITENDLNIKEDNSKQAIQLYLSRAYSIINPGDFFLGERVLQSLVFALRDSDFSELETVIAEANNRIEQVKLITVPSSWKEIHKQGLKLALTIRNIFVSFRDIENDPLKAYIALEELEDIPNNWNDLMEEAIDLANQQNIQLSL